MIVLYTSIFCIVNLSAYDILFDRPEDPRCWYNAGVSAFGDERYIQAAAFFEEAHTRLDDSDLMRDKALFNAGNSYAQAREYQKARDIFAALEEKNPTDTLVASKRKYLEQLLQQPPENPSDTEQNADGNTTPESDDQKPESERPKNSSEDTDKNGQDTGEQDTCKDQSGADKHKRENQKNTETTESTEKKEHKSEQDTAQQSSDNHNTQSAGQKSERQSALNERIAAYLDSVDAQGQEAFKSVVQQACSGRGVHEKNW